VSTTARLAVTFGKSSEVPSVGEKPAFRPEIQALRALAVSLVVIYHLAPPRLTGGFVGVDVFLVISGYLITSHLLRELQSSGGVSLRRFYMRRVRRLLPASLLVLLVTGLASLAFMPRNLWSEVGSQIVASAFYVENWALASNAVDYSAVGTDASPVQHFWSLSVEEQFYLVWPVALLGLFVLSRKSSQPKRILGASIALILAVSLTYSIWATSIDPAMAYFVTPARIWEFAVGGLLCFLPQALGRWRHALHLAQWAGVAAIVVSAVAMSDDTPFPGYAALLPVMGTALVIFAGGSGNSGAFGRIAGWRPVQYLGDISYSVYLWHWPLIILLPFVIDAPLTTATKALILVVSVGLGALSKKYVEDRFRTPAPKRTASVAKGTHRRTFAIALSMMLVVSLPAAILVYIPTQESVAAERELQESLDRRDATFGAASSATGDFSYDPEMSIVPSPVIAETDSWTKDAKGCQDRLEFEALKPCEFGSQAADALRVALVGDSHAGQWQPAMAEIALENDWNLTTFVRSSCPLSKSYPTSSTKYDNACQRWIEAVLTELTSGDYDVVVVSALATTSYQRPEGAPRHESAAAGIAQAWQQITAAGVKVVAIRDSPNPARAGIDDIPGCVASTADIDTCSFERRAALRSDPQLQAAEMSGTTIVSLSDYFCDDERCPAVIGGVLVYQNITHVTSTFIRSLTPYLNDKLIESVR
jgi:peptidoglycan/LPS O-acetylase OafA/YrhL